MIYLVQTPFVSQLRSYDQPGGYEKRAPYRGILTITHLTDTTIYISAAVGEMTREAWDQGVAMLKAQGIKTIMYERRGKIKTRTL